MNELLERIIKAGYGGVQIWCLEEGIWNGCLTGSNPDFAPNHDTNVWQHQPDPETVLLKLAENAEYRQRREKR